MSIQRAYSWHGFADTTREDMMYSIQLRHVFRSARTQYWTTVTLVALVAFVTGGITGSTIEGTGAGFAMTVPAGVAIRSVNAAAPMADRHTGEAICGEAQAAPIADRHTGAAILAIGCPGDGR